MVDLSEQTRFFIKQTYTFSLVSIALRYLPPSVLYPRGGPGTDDIPAILAAMAFLSGILAFACLPSALRDFMKHRQSVLLEVITKARSSEHEVDLARNAPLPEEKKLLGLISRYGFVDNTATFFEVVVPIMLGFTIFFLNLGDIFSLIASMIGGS
ncbi:hypothetical protein [Aurantiacibacter sp. D1-12]|uniref:hypothetical protein n=1 Tax=Aurantiacibacter sp. D1-12 TaxID=2993658 RepID=UPI00237D28D8|nr:hypothetical protein [Aurantiacibacter sp. D1-12]MDE1466917.1 hypothetical protein [Aurantiacibacter sp. D1-12]